MRVHVAIVLSALLSTQAATLDSWDGVVGRKYFSTGRAPLDVYTGLKTNPLFDNNDVEYRWIGNETVLLRSIFLINAEEFAADRVLLVLEGVDTLSTVTLNSQELGKTSNMYLRYTYDIKQQLTYPQQNTLTVSIKSSVKTAERLFNEQSKNYTVYPKCVPSAYNGECHVNHIRKMPASFSWDWGPALPGAGIWGDVTVVAFNDSTLFDTTTDVELAGDVWKVTATAHLQNAPSSADKPISGSVLAQLILKEGDFNIPDESVINSTTFTVTGEKSSMVSVVLTVPVSKVRRWWPNGYGDQQLYVLNVTLTTPRNAAHKVRRVGFRTVELTQEPLDKGLSFYFKINDVPIFAKGSNLIPTSLFGRQAANRTNRLLLQAAQETHMNMLRVWGGGMYENDYFYERADQYGIMIWQDFMFACAMYPTTPEFLDSVREEVRQNVWRLKSHPSVIVWAGNNENEAALYGNWYGTGREQVYRDDYVKLYVDVVKNEAEKNDKTRPFVVSSPSNGLYADQNGWIGTDPYSNLYGDIHYYNYFANSWDINTYRRPRFSSEYGFQSLPSIKAFTASCRNPKVDLIEGSNFLKHRQHLPGGEAYLKLLIQKNLRVADTGDPTRDFKSYIYLSQIHQAVAVKVQTESYRQAKSSINEAGEGKTMGALYWQLNDVWQAPTWSSIDVDGRWKMLHHYAEDFFAPVIITPRVTLDELKIFVVSDLLIPLTDCYVQLNVHKIWNGTRPNVYTKIIKNITVEANSARELPALSLEALLKEASCGATFAEAKNKCIIELLLTDSSYHPLTPPNYVYPVPPKDYDLPACDLYVTISMWPSWNVPKRLKKYYDGYDVTVVSSCTQLFVWFDGHGFYEGRISENGFHLLDGSRRQLLYLVEAGAGRPNPPEIFTKGLTVTSLGSIYATPPPRMDISITSSQSSSTLHKQIADFIYAGK